MKNATPLTPLAHERNSVLNVNNICTIHNHRGPEKNIYLERLLAPPEDCALDLRGLYVLKALLHKSVRRSLPLNRRLSHHVHHIEHEILTHALEVLLMCCINFRVNPYGYSLSIGIDRNNIDLHFEQTKSTLTLKS